MILHWSLIAMRVSMCAMPSVLSSLSVLIRERKSVPVPASASFFIPSALCIQKSMSPSGLIMAGGFPSHSYTVTWVLGSSVVLSESCKLLVSLVSLSLVSYGLVCVSSVCAVGVAPAGGL